MLVSPVPEGRARPSGPIYITLKISGGQEADAFIELFWARPLDLDVRSSLHDEEDDSFSTP